MTKKQLEKQCKASIVKMRNVVKSDNQFDKYRWLFLDAFSLGVKEAQKVYKQ